MIPKDEILFLRNKVENLTKISDTNKLISEFKWCADMVNSFYNEIDPKFKQEVIKIKLREREL